MREERRAGKMGINERAINRVNGRRHAILARRRVVDRLTDTLDELHLGRRITLLRDRPPR